MKLSILIPTLPSRIVCFNRLINHIQQQISTSSSEDKVEILALLDNKKHSVGDKRNMLLDLATSDFITFVDDDDRLSNNYIAKILETIELNFDSDCIVYDVICTIDSGKPIYCKYGIEYEYNWDVPNNKWFGKPAHTMIYNSKIAKKHRYKSINFGEDSDWVKRACLDIKKQTRINEVLYFYDHNTKTTETRK